MQMTPYIPDNAPFSPEQRAWLNGFLAGLFSEAPPAAQATAEKRASLRFGVYFASQTGTAERLAKKMAKELKTGGHTAEVASLETVSVARLARETHALIFASTYGEGDPPDTGRSFRDALFAPDAPVLTTLRYAVFCLGDRHYEHFCKFGIELDERLTALGATRLIGRRESDVDVDQPFTEWKGALRTRLAEKRREGDAAPAPNPAAPQAPENIHTRDNPYLAPLKERRALTSGVSSKLTMHLSFALEEAALHYQAGDACGVIAQNDPVLVDSLFEHLPFGGSAPATMPKTGILTAREALLHHLHFTRATRKMVQGFAEKSGSNVLKALLGPEQAVHLDAYLHDRGLIDLLAEYPGVLTEPKELVSLLPRLAPRLYSISSSPAAHGGELHCTVAVVRYRSHNRERGGVASTMFADRVEIGWRLPLYIQPNTRFRLPRDPATAMIMIGPGTGIAPFRAFLHERQALGHGGRNWLFFGERSAETDFLYRRELQAMCGTGHLTRLDTAFSRDQPHKIYVQDKMLESGADLWRWLNEGAQLFVCGDAARMAKDVDAALQGIVEAHGGMDAEAAREYIGDMHDTGRYHRDVY